MLWCLAEEIRKSSSLISVGLKCWFQSAQLAAVWDAQTFLHQILVNSSTESQREIWGCFLLQLNPLLHSSEEEEVFIPAGLSCLCWIPELGKSSLGSTNGQWNAFNVLFFVCSPCLCSWQLRQIVLAVSISERQGCVLWDILWGMCSSHCDFFL